MQENMYCLPITGMIYGTYNSTEERDEEHTKSCRPFLLLSNKWSSYEQNFQLILLIEFIKCTFYISS